MRLQVLQDSTGKQTGVFVPIEDWELIKNCYHDIETLNNDLTLWEKELIDSRLEAIRQNPERIRPIETFFEKLNVLNGKI
jgi:hypothetical protein